MSELRTLACLVLLFACTGAALAAADGADIPDPLRPPSQLASNLNGGLPSTGHDDMRRMQNTLKKVLTLMQ